LTEDVGFWSDGGGKVAAARRPLAGREEVMKFLIGLHRTAVTTGAFQDAVFTLREVNGEPAVVIKASDRVETVFVLSVIDGRIRALRAVRNPDKLRFIARQLASRVM
jgi:RNA polymerase sigma-70 factor (ECF subfamily)